MPNLPFDNRGLPFDSEKPLCDRLTRTSCLLLPLDKAQIDQRMCQLTKRFGERFTDRGEVDRLIGVFSSVIHETIGEGDIVQGKWADLLGEDRTVYNRYLSAEKVMPMGTYLRTLSLRRQKSPSLVPREAAELDYWTCESKAIQGGPFMSHDYGQAAAEARRKFMEDPHDLGALYILTKTELELAGAESLQPHPHHAADADWMASAQLHARELVERCPSSAEAWYQLGMAVSAECNGSRRRAARKFETLRTHERDNDTRERQHAAIQRATKGSLVIFEMATGKTHLSNNRTVESLLKAGENGATILILHCDPFNAAALNLRDFQTGYRDNYVDGAKKDLENTERILCGLKERLGEHLWIRTIKQPHRIRWAQGFVLPKAGIGCDLTNLYDAKMTCGKLWHVPFTDLDNLVNDEYTKYEFSVRRDAKGGHISDPIRYFFEEFLDLWLVDSEREQFLKNRRRCMMVSRQAT